MSVWRDRRGAGQHRLTPPPPPCAAPCRDTSQPIWVSLSRERTEMYRQIIDLEYGESELLEE